MDSEAYPRTTTPPPSPSKKVKQKQQQSDEQSINNKAMKEMMQWQQSVTRYLTDVDKKVTAIHSAVVKTAQEQTATSTTIVELLKNIEQLQQQADIIVLEDLSIQLDEVVKKLDDVTSKMQQQQLQQQQEDGKKEDVEVEATPAPAATREPQSIPTTLPTLAPTVPPTQMPTVGPPQVATPSAVVSNVADEANWNMLEQRVQQLESQTDMIASEVESMLHPQQQQQGGREQDQHLAEHMASMHSDVRSTTENLGRLFSYVYMRDRLKRNVKLRGRYSPGEKLRIHMEELPLGQDVPSYSTNDSVGSTVYNLNLP